MNHYNPILEDHKSLFVFRNMGLKLLQQLRSVMCEQTYSPFFKNVSTIGQNELTFTYLGQSFKTRIELLFRNDKMPDHAFIATYHIPEEKFKEEQEIVSYSFDLRYNVNDIFSQEDFADHYLIDFHQNLKKYYSDDNKPFPIKVNGK